MKGIIDFYNFHNESFYLTQISFITSGKTAWKDGWYNYNNNGMK